MLTCARKIVIVALGVVSLLATLAVAGCGSSKAPTNSPEASVFDLRAGFDLDGDGRVDRITITSMGAGSASALATLTSGGTFDIGTLHPMQSGSMVSLSCNGSQLTVEERVDSGGRITLRLTDLVGVAGTVTERPQASFDVTSLPLPSVLVASSCR